MLQEIQLHELSGSTGMQHYGGKGKENRQMLLQCISAEPPSVFFWVASRAW